MARTKEQVAAYNKAYEKTETGKAARRRAMLKYRRSEKYKARRRAHPGYTRAGKASLARNRASVLEAKNKPCADCGVSYPFYVMHLDHVPERGPKLFNLGYASNRNYAAVLAEIAKCDSVCANCHAARTYHRMIRSGP